MNEEFIQFLFRFYIALAGIIGAFFYIQMGNWLQNVLKLDKKWRVTRFDKSPKGEKAKFELQFELGEYQNPVFGILLAIVNIFIILMFILSLVAVGNVETPPGLGEGFLYYAFPFWLFSIFFVLSSIMVSAIGYLVLYRVNKALKDWLKG